MAVKVVGPEQMFYLGLVALLVGWRAVRTRFLRWRRQQVVSGRPATEKAAG
jgi:sulfoxide reductase heme-binding subunit YedZ